MSVNIYIYIYNKYRNTFIFMLGVYMNIHTHIHTNTYDNMFVC